MPKTYIVKENDTLYGIVASECPGAPPQQAVNKIVEANNLANADQIYIDQLLVLPCAEDGEEPEIPATFKYIVKSGDTLIGIANSLNTQCQGLSWQDIAAENGLSAPYTIFTGQGLTIPCAGGEQQQEGFTVPDVPYYSQNDDNSDLSSTDCGPTCVRMVLGWHRKKNGKPDPSDDPTVNDLWNKTGLASGDLVNVNTLINLANDYPLTLKRKKAGSARIDWITDQIDDGYPVIMLCHYGTIKPADATWTGGHFVVVVGYSPTHIYYHDPNWLGSRYSIKDRGVFNQAIGVDNNIDGNPSYLGIYVER